MIHYGVYGHIHGGIPTPMGQDVWGHTFLNAQHSTCGQFELNYHRCMEAFGYYLGVRYCDLEFRDFWECSSGDKKVKRLQKIRDERWKNFLKGETDRPFLVRYPQKFECRPDYYDRSRIF